VKRRPVRRGRWRSRRLPTLLVGLALSALLAHLLIAAHAVAHLSQRSSDVATQHCATCVVGKHSPGVPTLVTTASAVTVTWLMECVEPPLAPLPEVEAGTLARGPPLRALATIG
jgi:hypothetical protein